MCKSIPFVAFFLCSLVPFVAATQDTDSLRNIETSDTTKPKNTAPIENAVRDILQDSTPVSVTDSVVAELKQPVKPKALSVRAIVVPSAMIAYGAFTLTNKTMQKLN